MVGPPFRSSPMGNHGGEAEWRSFFFWGGYRLPIHPVKTDPVFPFLYGRMGWRAGGVDHPRCALHFKVAGVRGQ